MISKTEIAIALFALASQLVSAEQPVPGDCQLAFCEKLTRQTKDLVSPSFYNGFGKIGDSCWCPGKDSIKYFCNKWKREAKAENATVTVVSRVFQRPDETGDWLCEANLMPTTKETHSVESVQPTGYATTTSKSDCHEATATASVDVDSGAYQVGAFIALLGPLFAL